jgi:hypothetical protein
LRSEWSLFEDELVRNLDLEEKEIPPRFRVRHPEEADAILAEHDQIRAALVELGVRLDLHLLDARAVQDFVGLLRAHARREEHSLYPVASRILHAPQWNAIRRALSEARPGAAPGEPSIS